MRPRCTPCTLNWNTPHPTICLQAAAAAKEAALKAALAAAEADYQRGQEAARKRAAKAAAAVEAAAQRKAAAAAAKKAATTAAAASPPGAGATSSKPRIGGEPAANSSRPLPRVPSATSQPSASRANSTSPAPSSRSGGVGVYQGVADTRSTDTSTTGRAEPSPPPPSNLPSRGGGGGGFSGGASGGGRGPRAPSREQWLRQLELEEQVRGAGRKIVSLCVIDGWSCEGRVEAQYAQWGRIPLRLFGYVQSRRHTWGCWAAGQLQ